MGLIPDFVQLLAEIFGFDDQIFAELDNMADAIVNGVLHRAHLMDSDLASALVGVDDAELAPNVVEQFHRRHAGGEWELWGQSQVPESADRFSGDFLMF